MASLRDRGDLVDEAHRDLDDGQRLEPEEVELDQARELDVVLVVLRDVDAFFGAEDGHVIPERTFADHDAGRVHARVAVEVLERHRPCR